MIKKSPVSNKEIHNDSISSTEEQIDIKQLIQSSTKNKRALYSSIGRYHQKIDLSYIKKKNPKSSSNTVINSKSISIDNSIHPLLSMKNKKQQIENYNDKDSKLKKDGLSQSNSPFKNKKKSNFNFKKSWKPINKDNTDYFGNTIYMTNPIINQLIRNSQENKSVKDVEINYDQVKEDKQIKIKPYNEKNTNRNQKNERKSISSQTCLNLLTSNSRKKSIFEDAKYNAYFSFYNKKMLVPYLQNPHGYKKWKQKILSKNNSMISVRNKPINDIQNDVSPINFDNKKKRPQTTIKLFNRDGLYLTNPYLSNSNKIYIKLDDETTPNLLKINKIFYNEVSDIKFDHHFLLTNMKNFKNLVFPLKYNK